MNRYPALALDGRSVILVPPGDTIFGFSLFSGMIDYALGFESFFGSSSALVALFTLRESFD